jgi:PAS domain S-box-containing protein
MLSLADLVIENSDEEILKRYGHKGVRKSEIHPQAFETVGSIWIKGKEHIMAIQATRLRDAAGNIVGAIQCAQDITGRKRAEEALQNELNKFRVLYELSLNMSAEKRIEDNLLFIVEKSRQLLKADTAYVALADDGNEFVYMHILSGIRTEAFKKMKLPYGKGLGGLVMKTRQGYIITDYFEHAGINHVVDDIVSEEGVVSGMAVPIQAGERSLGVLYVFNRRKTDFSKSDLDTLYLLGNLAGVEIARQRMERDLRESEVKYRTVFENSGSAMVIVEEDTTISLANEEFIRLSGFNRQEVEGKKKWTEFVVAEDLPLMMEQHKRRRLTTNHAPGSYEFRFINRRGQIKNILVTVDMMPTSNRSVAALMDITALKQAEAAIKQAYDDLEARVAKRTAELTMANSRLNELLKKQNVNVDLAKNIMGIINGSPPRHKEIGEQADLFISNLYLPCYAEGGDHFLIKHIADPTQKARTIISLKDQSGHEVSCILRSIITDLFHNAVIAQSWGSVSLGEEISRLNDMISSLDVFGAENFVTSIEVAIQHSNLIMHYLAAGHPPLLLIRNGDVIALPDLQGKGRNLPIGIARGIHYETGMLQLQLGDKLILVTDGLMEIPCRKGLPILQYEELCDIVKELVRSQPDLPVSGIVPALLMAVAGQDEWNQETPVLFSDDVTILGVEIEDRSSGEVLLFNPRDMEDFSAQFSMVYNKIKSQWDERGFAGGKMRLRMVLEESLANAWHHGHRQRSDFPILVRHRYGNDAVIEVIDQGEGFDWESLNDPTTLENRIKDCGRGVYIIRQYADEVYWKDKGRHLVAYFSLTNHLPGKTKKQETMVDIWSRKYLS